MKATRFGIAVATAAVLAVGLAGCKKDSESSSPQGSTSHGTNSSQAASTAKDKLQAAVTALSKSTFHFTIAMSGAGIDAAGATSTMSGDVDAEKKISTMDMKMTASSMTMTMNFIVRPEAVYLRMTGLPMGGLIPGDKWVKVDATKLSGDLRARLLMSGDPTGVDSFGKAVIDVRETSAGAFEGTIDITKSTGSLTLDKNMIKDMPTTTVPFTAKVDGQGRLTSMRLTLTAKGEPSTFDITYSKIGEPVSADAPPASQIAEGNDLLYQILAGMG